MYRRKMYDTTDYTVHVWFDGDITRAEVNGIAPDYPKYTIVHATAVAKRHADDDYSQRIGEQLAVSRAMQRYYRKIERLALKEAK